MIERELIEKCLTPNRNAIPKVTEVAEPLLALLRTTAAKIDNNELWQEVCDPHIEICQCNKVVSKLDPH